MSAEQTHSSRRFAIADHVVVAVRHDELSTGLSVLNALSIVEIILSLIAITQSDIILGAYGCMARPPFRIVWEAALFISNTADLLSFVHPLSTASSGPSNRR